MISHHSWQVDMGSISPSHLSPIASALSSLPSLRILDVDIAGAVYHLLDESKSPPLRDFKNLSTLSVSCYEDIPKTYCLQAIAPVTNASPSLAKLNICNFYTFQMGVRKYVSLHRLLKDSKLELVQLKLGRVPLRDQRYPFTQSAAAIRID
jgi:hypothetical protein